MKKNPSLHSPESPRTQVKATRQVILIFISMTCIMGLLFWRTDGIFRAFDQMPELHPITPEKITEWGGFSGVVNVGLYIDEFQRFSMVGNQFVLDGILWFKFDPGVVSLDTLQKFSFDNGTILYRSPADTKVDKGKLVVRYNIRVQFSSNLDYKEFPMDDHRISLALVNRFLEPSEVIFKSTQREFTIEPDMSFKGWQEVDKDVETGYIDAHLDPLDDSQVVIYPAIIFSINYSRASIRYTLSILLPLAIMFFLTLFSLSLTMRAALPIAGGGITAILAYRFVIENLSPRVGYFMASDFIFFLFLGTALGVFILNVAESLGKITLSSQAKLAILTLFHLLIVGSILYLVLW